MKIGYVGKFEKLHDEEYIARSFEAAGHTVYRIPQTATPTNQNYVIERLDIDVLLFAKWERFDPEMYRRGIKTVCWLFDLYFDYVREWRIREAPFFRADYVFTTDGGHQDLFERAGINHRCVRQGIYAPECLITPPANPHGVVFVGSDNPDNKNRRKQLSFIESTYPDFRWYGTKSTDEVRGTALNDLYATAKVVIGDSVASPRYWSNRVVETLGRGGFLIHAEVEGIRDEYPDLVTYQQDDFDDLQRKIDYYLTHEEERLAIVQKNFEWVRDHYTMDKKCAELLALL